MAVDVNKSIEEIEVSLTTSGVEKTERQLKKLSKAEKLVADSSAKVTKNVEKLSKKQKKILAKQAKDKIKANRKAEREEKRHAERMQRLAEDEELKKQPMKVRTMDQVGTPIRKSKAQREFERKLELTRVKNIKKPIKDNANISPVVSKIMKHQTTGTVELGPKNQAKALRFWEKMKKGVDDYGKSFKIIEKKTEKFVDTDEKAGKAVTNNRKKEEKKRKNAGVFPYGKENTTLSALILRMGGALGIGMMLAGIAQRAIESVSTGVVAIGDAQEKKRKNQAFINNYQNSDYNSAVNTYSQLSGTNKYNSRDVMTQALQQLQGDNVKLRSGGAVDLAKVIKGLQQYNGLDEEHATQSAVGLISGNTSLSTMNMSKVRKSDDPNVTLKNILKFLDKNVGQDSDQSIQSMINQMKTGPQGLGRYLMDVHEQQFTDIVSTISNFVHDTFDFDNENVKKAWSSALTNVQNDVQTLFGGKSGTTFSEGLAYVFATFVDGLTLGAIWMEVLYYRIKEFTGFLGQHKWAKMAVEFGIGITVFNEVIKVVGGLLKPITNFGSALIWIGKKFGFDLNHLRLLLQHSLGHLLHKNSLEHLYLYLQYLLSEHIQLYLYLVSFYPYIFVQKMLMLLTLALQSYHN